MGVGRSGAYDELPRTPANFVALSPLRYLERAAYIYPNQAAIIHGQRRISWREKYKRCRQFAHQLYKMGVGKNAPKVANKAIPVSLIGTFAAMSLFGFSLNILSLSIRYLIIPPRKGMSVPDLSDV